MKDWDGGVTFRWVRSGRLLAEQQYVFTVQCDEPPRDDRLNSIDARRKVTLQLVCADAMKRYGIPPNTVQTRIEQPADEYFGALPVLDRARWRMGSGFCYGSGIMRVGAPPEGARLVGLREISTEQVR